MTRSLHFQGNNRKVSICAIKSEGKQTPSGVCSVPGRECLTPRRECLTPSRDCLIPSGDCLTASGECLTASGVCLTATGDCLTASGECLTASGVCLTASGDCLTTSGLCNAPRRSRNRWNIKKYSDRADLNQSHLQSDLASCGFASKVRLYRSHSHRALAR